VARARGVRLRRDGGRRGAAVAFTWLVGLLLLLLTVATCSLAGRHRLIRPQSYRVVAGGLLATSFGGAALGGLPHSSGDSKVLAVYFGVMAALAYAALRARGPGRALLASLIGLIGWLPFAFVTLVGCKFPTRLAPHWREPMTWSVLQLAIARHAAGGRGAARVRAPS
jgi:hypothetical protein